MTPAGVPIVLLHKRIVLQQPDPILNIPSAVEIRANFQSGKLNIKGLEPFFLLKKIREPDR
jgi:hypothetical protein